jgi:diguanylate cyclase
VRYKESAAQSAELLRLIVPRIAAHGGHFTPWAYSVWYEHLAGMNPRMSEELEARLRINAAVTSADIVDLYDAHIQSSEMRSVTQLQAGLGELLRKLGEIAAQSSKGAAQYYDALVAHEQELASIVDADTLRDVLDALKTSTVSVRMNASMLHTEIEAGREQMRSLHQQLNTLKGEALADPLTGLNNRRGFERCCERLYGDRNGVCRGAALLLLDIDYFKQINDSYGHLFGDQVLRAAAQVISTSVKGRDVAVRFGGDEFLVLLPDTSVEGALAVAEHIRAGFGRARIRRGGSDTCLEQVTLSVGVAVSDSSEMLEQALHRVDQALYRAKAEGRNRICVAIGE